METSKEQMSKYLDKMQYLQRVCLGHTVSLNINNVEQEVFIDFCVMWEDRFTERKCKCFSLREWLSKEENDYRMNQCIDFLTKEKKWM